MLFHQRNKKVVAAMTQDRPLQIIPLRLSRAHLGSNSRWRKKTSSWRATTRPARIASVKGTAMSNIYRSPSAHDVGVGDQIIIGVPS
jgi:hypothetical protein